MKTNYLWTLILISALALTGCKSKNEPTIDTPTIERPTWQAVATDYYGYMTVILDAASLPAKIDNQDLISAYIGDTCRGVAAPYLEQDSIVRIYLSVKPSEQEASNPDQQVELRYYSEKEKHIYTSQPVAYADEEMLGSMDEGYQPTWR